MSLITLADEEQKHLHDAFEKYKPYTSLADATVELFGGMVESVTVPAPSFVAFYAQAKKHSALGFFSLLRGHRSQYKLTLRYFLESLVQAAYASFHPDHSEYFDTEAKEAIKQDLVVRRANKWITDIYPTVSANIKEIKERLNTLSSHANFVTTFIQFKMGEDGSHETPFFDYENELVTKADLLECSRVASIAVDLLLACSKDTGLMRAWGNRAARRSRRTSRDRAPSPRQRSWGRHGPLAHLDLRARKRAEAKAAEQALPSTTTLDFGSYEEPS